MQTHHNNDSHIFQAFFHRNCNKFPCHHSTSFEIPSCSYFCYLDPCPKSSQASTQISWWFGAIKSLALLMGTRTEKLAFSSAHFLRTQQRLDIIYNLAIYVRSDNEMNKKMNKKVLMQENSCICKVYLLCCLPISSSDKYNFQHFYVSSNDFQFQDMIFQWINYVICVIFIIWKLCICWAIIIYLRPGFLLGASSLFEAIG